MRRYAIALSAAALLISLLAGSDIASGAQQMDQVEAPVGPGPNDPNCHATSEIDPPVAARLSIGGNITTPGPHEATLQSLSKIIVFPSLKWGGGRVTIPSGQISASLTFQGLPELTRPAPVDSRGDRPARAELLTFQITSLKATIKSFVFPRKLITGPNSFEIIKERSFVQVFGSRGTVPISGDAQAWLTNRVFSKDAPARVRVTFWGTYNFESRRAVLSRLEAHAHSSTAN